MHALKCSHGHTLTRSHGQSHGHAAGCAVLTFWICALSCWLLSRRDLATLCR